MSDDLYRVLGVAKTATSDDIRKAHRALAKKHHPDLNPGDKSAEETFKKIQLAYDILSDDGKRRQYDAGEIDAEGNETQRGYYREYASGDGANPYHSSAGYDDLGDIFSDLFGRRGTGGERAHLRMRGGDVRYSMEIAFLEAVNGAKKRVTMPDGKALDITIPPGHRDGQMLRLRGQGMPGLGGGEAGDAFVEIHVAKHKIFDRNGDDIHIVLPVALHEAVLGAKVRVPTASGVVAMTIPAGSNSGDTLRLKGKGVPARRRRPAGDQIVTLRVMLPASPDDRLAAFMKEWSADHAYNPRTGVEGYEDAQ